MEIVTIIGGNENETYKEGFASCGHVHVGIYDVIDDTKSKSR